MKFICTAIKRDIYPFNKNRNLIDTVIQSFLPFLGSYFIIFTISLTSFLCYGFYIGYSKHLYEIEKDPFSTTIVINGNIRDNKELKKFLYLRWNDQKEKFYIDQRLYNENNNKQKEKIVKNGTMFSLRGLRFIDSEGYISSNYPHYGFSVQPENVEMKNSIIHLCYNKNSYFEKKNDYGLILNDSLIKKLGYKEHPEKINIIAPGVYVGTLYSKYLRGKMDSKPMSKKELALHTITIPVKNIATNLFHGYFVCSDDLVTSFSVSKKNNPFDKSRKIDYFRILCPENIEQEFFERQIKLFSEKNKNLIKKCLITREEKQLVAIIRCNKPVSIYNVINSYYSFFEHCFKEHKENLMNFLIISKPDNLNSKLYYNGFFLNLFNNDKVLENINSLYDFFIEYSAGKYHANLFQLQILKRYKEETTRLYYMSFYINIFIIATSLIAATVIFLMWINLRFHKIGIFFAFGASRKKMAIIFFVEMFILAFFAVLTSWGFSYFIFPLLFEQTGFDNEWLLSHSYIAIILIIITLLAFIVSLLSVLYLKTKMPYDMICHRE